MAKARNRNGPIKTDVCTCAPAPAANGQAARGLRPTHAVGVDAALKAANLMQLRRIEGQVRGIAAMVEDDRYCADIITQISAVRESLHAVARNLMRNHLTHCAAKALHEKGVERDRMVEELLDLVSKIAR